MTDRKRDPLPEGYQFGHAAWRNPATNAADRLRRWPVKVTDNGFTANVIEGEHFTTDRDHGDEA